MIYFLDIVQIVKLDNYLSKKFFDLILVKINPKNSVLLAKFYSLVELLIIQHYH